MAMTMTNQVTISHDRFALLVALVTGILCGAGGFLVIILGSRERIAVHFAALAVCVGFGIILGALGTRTTGKWLGWTIAGRGAVAFPLLILFEYYLNPGYTKFGRIEGDLSQVSDLRIVDDHPLYEYRDPTTRSMQFIMLKDRFAHPRISVQVDTRDPNDILIEMIGDGDEIASKHIGKHWEDAARWEFDYGKRIVRDGDAVIFKELREQNEEIIPQKKVIGELPSYLIHTVFGSSSAFAQRVEVNTQDLESSVRDLKDDDPKVRRNARDELIARGPLAVAPMLRSWHEDPDNYRIRLGTAVVLNDILRNDASAASIFLTNLPMMIFTFW